MKEYEDIFELLDDICKIKSKVVKLKYNEVIKIRTQLYNLGFPEKKINVIWDFIWDYITYEELMERFESDNYEDNIY